MRLGDLERRVVEAVLDSAEIDGQRPSVDPVFDGLSTPESRALIARIKARRDTV